MRHRLCAALANPAAIYLRAGLLRQMEQQNRTDGNGKIKDYWPAFKATAWEDGMSE